jgi:hypothetical protein
MNVALHSGSGIDKWEEVYTCYIELIINFACFLLTIEYFTTDCSMNMSLHGGQYERQTLLLCYMGCISE